MTFAVRYIGVRIAETLACVALSWESGSEAQPGPSEMRRTSQLTFECCYGAQGTKMKQEKTCPLPEANVEM